jgi:YhcG PDDEXK nuclease domain
MNFYVSAVDDLLRSSVDNLTIGIVLCKTQDQTIVEYALRDMNKPIGIPTYQLKYALPAPLQGNLPTIEELETQSISYSNPKSVMRKPKRGLGTASPRKGQRPLYPFSQILWDCYIG